MTDGSRVVIAAGGTGGHLFPAQALAQELGRRGWRIWLMTDERANRYGATFPCEEIIEIPSATISPRRPLRALAGVGKLAMGFARAWRRLGALEPAAVVGFGGYPTLPPLAAAMLRGIPTCIHEQNAVIGRANRMLAGKASRIASTFENPLRLPDSARARLSVTGNPVRDAVAALAGTPYRAPSPGEKFNLLVFGGSQGARVFSDVLPSAIGHLAPEDKVRLTITQQCREEDMARVRRVYEDAGVVADLAPFFTDLPRRIVDAQLVICRSGASTLSELGVIGRPALVVPLPGSLEGDQFHNARAFETAGGGWLMEQQEFTPIHLAAWFGEAMADPQKLETAAQGAMRFGKPDAAVRLADLIESLAPGRAAGRIGTDGAASGGKSAENSMRFEVAE